VIGSIVVQLINDGAGELIRRATEFGQVREGRIVYKLTLNPEGKLLKLDVQSSGESELDEAAEAAIRAAAPFPHLPELGGSTYQLTGAIVYKLDDD
jgi:protein TonB